MSFYFRLGVIRRDMENILAETDNDAAVTANRIQIVASRFGQALKPGLQAIEALGSKIPNAPEIEERALRIVDLERDKRPGTLRQRLAAAIQDDPTE
jgi:hypothetical protein